MQKMVEKTFMNKFSLLYMTSLGFFYRGKNPTGIINYYTFQGDPSNSMFSFGRNHNSE